MPLMAPLLVITTLFSFYIHQQHFRVAEYLPAHACAAADRKNAVDFDASFLHDAYLQPELKVKEELPDVDDDQLPLVLRMYHTPNQSQEDKCIDGVECGEPKVSDERDVEPETTPFFAWMSSGIRGAE